MPKGNRRTSAVELPHSHSVDVRGRTMTTEDEFSVVGEYGWFGFRYVYEPDGSVCGYGPLGKQTAMRRAFTVDQIKTVRKRKVPK